MWQRKQNKNLSMTAGRRPNSPRFSKWIKPLFHARSLPEFSIATAVADNGFETCIPIMLRPRRAAQVVNSIWLKNAQNWRGRRREKLVLTWRNLAGSSSRCRPSRFKFSAPIQSSAENFSACRTGSEESTLISTQASLFRWMNWCARFSWRFLKPGCPNT